MNITELIAMGEECKQEARFYGEKYENWIAASTRFMETNLPAGDQDSFRFKNLVADKKFKYGDEGCWAILAILKAVQIYPTVPVESDIMSIITNICVNFNKFDINIKRRYGNRETITIKDEYDVQDAMHSILKLFIDDIRPEDYVPSYAGGNSRVDFFLPQHGIVIETKMTNKNLSDAKIGEQLIIDFDRYKQQPSCNHLVCFVYDKDSHITNPFGIITDLEKKSDQNMRITVFICPQ